MTNDDGFLFGMLLNHCIVSKLYFHGLTFAFLTNKLLIIDLLLISPISDLEDLTNLNSKEIFCMSFSPFYKYYMTYRR